MHFASPRPSPRYSLFSWRTIVLLALALAVVTTGCVFFFLHSRTVIERLVKDRLRNEAAIAAMQFTGEEIDAIRSPEDRESPHFGEIIWRLKDIRAHTPGIRFAYIMRRTDDPFTLAFVADADALDTPEQLDRNGNGAVDPDEEPGLPGDAYDIRGIPALQGDAFIEPTTDEDLTLDQWGYSLSGYAPIWSHDGRAVAVLGIDMMAQDYAEILQSIFSMQSLLLSLFGVVLLILSIITVIVRHRMEQIRHLDDERRWLLQLILHQVGTPLTIFKWGVESLREMLPHLPMPVQEEARENVLIMEDGVSRLDHVAEVLLAADRVQEGSMEVTEERVSLRNVIDETVAGVASRLTQRGLRIAVDVPDCTVTIDRRLLSGVLRELLDNAITYSPQQGIIALRGIRRNKHVEMQVQDRGAGIPRKDIPRIFERFSRGSNAGTYDPNGTGVGLYIAKGIIERFGGTMTVTSIEGQGTTFTFTLPVSR